MTPKKCGVEIDIRPYGKNLVLNHEPFSDGERLSDFLQEYNHSLLILNVKSEGIELEILKLMEKHGIENYFFLDVTFPYMVKYMNNGVNQFAVRFSEYESINTCLNLIDKVTWVFIDNFTRLPIENNSIKFLSAFFKICVVSPELLKRSGEIDMTKDILQRYPVDAILTDSLNGW